MSAARSPSASGCLDAPWPACRRACRSIGTRVSAVRALRLDEHADCLRLPRIRLLAMTNERPESAMRFANATSVSRVAELCLTRTLTRVSRRADRRCRTRAQVAPPARPDHTGQSAFRNGGAGLLSIDSPTSRARRQQRTTQTKPLSTRNSACPCAFTAKAESLWRLGRLGYKCVSERRDAIGSPGGRPLAAQSLALFSCGVGAGCTSIRSCRRSR
jgi:hypothetical protein